MILGIALLAGCVLPEPGELSFVEGAFATDGELTREYVWGVALAGRGFVDCETSFDAVGDVTEPESGCPGGCDTTLKIDFGYAGTDCPELPSGEDSDVTNQSIGVDGDSALLHDGEAWTAWLEGSGDDGAFDGESDWTNHEAGAGEDYTRRDRLVVSWVGE